VTPTPLAGSRGRPGGLRGRLVLAVASAGLFAILLNAALLGVALHQTALDQQGAFMARQAMALGRCCRFGRSVLLASRVGVVDQTLRVALAGTPGRRALIVDAQGSPRYASPSLPADLEQTLLGRLRRDLAAPALASGWNVVDGYIIAEGPIAVDPAGAPAAVSRPAGALLLAEDEGAATRSWQRTVTLVVLSGLAAVALTTLAGAVTVAAITRPIRALTAAARGVAAGDYTVRAPPEGTDELRELAHAFNTMVHEVVQQRRVERDLLANVSHELATPLGVIGGYAENLAEGAIASEEDRQVALRAIEAEARRLGRLTGDLLDLALLETGQVRVQPEPVPLGELLAGVRARFAPAAASAGVALTLDAADAPTIVTDGLRLEQALINLVANALHHTPAGGTVALAAHPTGGVARLWVADTGAGIPPDELPRIWERFYRVDKGRDRSSGGAGVGLGLAICRGTVTLLRGRIGVESAPGTGTTFTIDLPLRLDENRPA
jgi:two-component system sensor histidine kinase BaeS